jgi:hypothetical protein
LLLSTTLTQRQAQMGNRDQSTGPHSHLLLPSFPFHRSFPLCLFYFFLHPPSCLPTYLTYYLPGHPV